MSVFWATVIGAVIGAAGAIAGGFAAAWWQTSRADDVAQKIRRAERREEGLRTLWTEVQKVYGEIETLYLEAEAGNVSGSQYGRATDLLRDLLQLWFISSSRVIPDQPIVDAFDTLVDGGLEHLPEGDVGDDRQLALHSGDMSEAERFVRDLAYVLGLITECINAVANAVKGLLDPPTRRSGFSAATKPWWSLSRSAASRSRDHLP